MIGPPLKQALVPDIRLLAIADQPRLKQAIASLSGDTVAAADGELLVELPVAVTLEELGQSAGARPRKVRDLGGFFQPIRLMAERVA